MVNLESALPLINLCKCVIQRKFVLLAFSAALYKVEEKLFVNAATVNPSLSAIVVFFLSVVFFACFVTDMNIQLSINQADMCMFENCVGQMQYSLPFSVSHTN